MMSTWLSHNIIFMIIMTKEFNELSWKQLNSKGLTINNYGGLILIMSQTDREESFFEASERILSKYNKVLIDKLTQYNMKKYYSLFVIQIILLSLLVGLSVALYLSLTDLAFPITVLIFGVLGSWIAAPLVGSIFVGMYANLYSKKILPTIMTYQNLTLFIAILISWYFSSINMLSGGLVIYLILAMIYPTMKYLHIGGMTTQELETTLKKWYKIIFIILNLAQIILKFAGLF